MPPCFAAIKGGVRQLEAQANILLLALALSCPGVLQHGPLQVVGTVVVGTGTLSLSAQQHWERVQLTVGGKGGAPEAVMQPRVRR